MIELSNNEAASLVKLAARGAGYPWGLSEEAVQVSRWLVERQLPALELLNNLFNWVDESGFSQLLLHGDDLRWHCSRGQLCPLVCGAAIIDTASRLVTVDRVQLDNVVYPMLLMPFIYEASVMLDKSIRVTWDDEELLFSGTCVESFTDTAQVVNKQLNLNSPASIGISVDGSLLDTPSAFTDSSAVLPTSHRRPLWPVLAHCRVSTGTQCLESLKQYAHRTYAPATELSRMSGAGAGTSDND